jgi:hypothetical protein
MKAQADADEAIGEKVEGLVEAVEVVAQVKNSGLRLQMQVRELRKETNAGNFLPLVTPFSGILRRRNKS